MEKTYSLDLESTDFRGGLIDAVEDWLDEKGVDIPNHERDEEDPDNDAKIWGEDFDILADKLCEAIRISAEEGPR